MKKHYFQWKENNYGSYYRNNLILLRSFLNDYAALDSEASSYLCFILQNQFLENCKPFILDTNTETQAGIDKYKLNDYIEYFINQDLIEKTESEKRRNVISFPIEPIGLSEREWYSQSKNIKLDKKLFLKAVFFLNKVHSVINKKKMTGVLDLINKLGKEKKLKTPSIDQSLIIAKALDVGCQFYPKKTLCLPFAATLAILHYKEQYKCDFVIGVQNLPFYAHAWVEVDGSVINDRPELKLRLAPIVKITPEDTR